MLPPWLKGGTTEKDVILTIPQQALIQGVPTTMWNDEAISQIGSRAMPLAGGDQLLNDNGGRIMEDKCEEEEIQYISVMVEKEKENMSRAGSVEIVSG